MERKDKMTSIYGNIWSIFGKTDLFCITTNSYIKKNGCLVMGKGLALEARRKIPGIDQRFGQEITLSGGHLGSYGLIVLEIENPCRQIVGGFQVKKYFKNQADLKIIKYSTEKLLLLARTLKIRIDLNFPGIGNGRLKKEEVLPIIEKLPDNVYVWEKSITLLH